MKKAVEKKNLKNDKSVQTVTDDDLNQILGRAEMICQKEKYKTPRYPLVFIVGVPGSGTTLFFQWMASTGAFAYPTNLMARFDQAPYIASKISRMLSDPESSPFNELALPAGGEPDFFSSDLGKTYGLFAPNNFSGFWMRFFPPVNYQPSAGEQSSAVDWDGFERELAAMETVFAKPLTLKTFPEEQHLVGLAQRLKNSLFVHIRRQPFYNAQSLFLARKRMKKAGKNQPDRFHPEYPEFNDLSIYKQVSAQLFHTDLAIVKGLGNVPDGRKLELFYDDFCKAPRKVWDEINSRFNRMGFTMHRDYNSVRHFEARNKLQISKRDKERLSAAYYSMFGEDITPPELSSKRKKRSLSRRLSKFF